MRSTTDVLLGVMEGDELLIEANWLDDHDVTRFTVENYPGRHSLQMLAHGEMPRLTLRLRGEDGERYRFYADKMKIGAAHKRDCTVTRVAPAKC